MIDIWTVCKKELKELLSPYGDRRGSLLRAAVLCGVFGLVIPLTQKGAWMETPLAALFFLAIPLPIVSGVVIDSFAGERERGTLETLLATRLPNRAILFGKVLAVIVYAWSITLISIFLSLIGLNLAENNTSIFFYPNIVCVSALIGSFLIAGLMAGVGVLVSLKAKSVRAAQQTLSISMLALFFGIGFGLPALVGILIPKDTAVNLQRAYALANLWIVTMGGLSILAVLDAVILAFVARQFKRARLGLDGTSNETCNF